VPVSGAKTQGHNPLLSRHLAHSQKNGNKNKKRRGKKFLFSGENRPNQVFQKISYKSLMFFIPPRTKKSPNHKVRALAASRFSNQTPITGTGS
jgi:hypothetical protein